MDLATWRIYRVGIERPKITKNSGSNIAGGGGGIFAPKPKIAPPSAFGSGSCEGVAVMWTRIVEFLGSGAHPKLVKTFFFGDHLNLTEKPLQSRLRLMKIWVKFVYSYIKLPKKPPPLFEILATRLNSGLILYSTQTLKFS